MGVAATLPELSEWILILFSPGVFSLKFFAITLRPYE